MPFHAKNDILGFSRSPAFPCFQPHFQRWHRRGHRFNSCHAHQARHWFYRI